MPAWLREGASAGCELTLHIQPGAARTELAGEHGDALKLRVHARPVEGAANAALLEFMADHLAVPRREVRLLRGDKSRRKTLWLPLAPQVVLARLNSIKP